jgi:hypothetical protein
VSTWRTPFSTDHVVHELEARAALESLYAQKDLAELSRPTRLLLVPAVPVGGTHDGLAVRNARRFRLDVHAVALGHALEQHAQVQLAHAVEHGLVERGVALHAQAGVLGQQLVQGIGEALLIAAALGLDGDA